MNMIPTGAFLTEMDASEKKETLAEQFVSIWEKKNSKIARAGGVSLMALSLAACGGSSDTAATDTPAAETPAEETETPAAETPAEETPAEETPVEEVTPVVTELAVAALTADTTMKTTDDLDGGDGTADELSLSLSADFAGFVVDPDAADTGSMVGYETISLAADSLARSFDATGVSGVVTYKIDGSNGGVVSIADSADLAAIELSNIASGAFSITYAAPTGGTSPVAGSDDTLSLTVEGLGSASADISVTAAGVEKLAITSNAAASAAGATNYLNLSAVDATEITAAGAADLDIAAVKTGTTSFDASTATGSVTAVLTAASANGLATVKTGSGDDKVTVDANDMKATGVVDMGDGADELVMSSTAADTLQLTMSGVETVDVTDLVAGTTTISLANTTGLETINAGAASGANDFAASTVAFVNASGAQTINLTGQSNTSGLVSTDTTGEVTMNIAADADATKISGDTSQAELTADKAGTVNVNTTGYINYTGTISAAKATTLNVTTAQAQSALDINAAKAETVNITAAKAVTATASDLSGAKVVTIDSAAATEVGALASLVTATLSGAGDDAAIDLGAVGAADLANDITITATGLKSGLDIDDTGNIKSAGAVTIDAAGVTGTVDIGTITSTGAATVKIGEGAATIDAIDASSATLDLTAGTGAITIGNGAAGAGADVTVGGSVTITSNAITATSLDIVGDKTALTVTSTGSLDADLIDISNSAAAGFTGFTVSGDLGLGADIVNIAVTDADLASGVSSGTVTQTIDVSGVKSATVMIDVDATVGGDAASDTTVVTGTKDSDSTDTVRFADTFSNQKVTMTDIDVVHIKNDVAMNASALSGTSSEIKSDAGADTLTLSGTAGADTVDFSSLSANATVPVFIIDMGVGADVVTLGDVDETYVIDAAGADSGATVATADSITGFDLTTDATGASENIGDILDISGATAAVGSTATDANVSSVTAGKITFADATLALADLIVDAATVTAAAGQAAFFVHDGDTYVVVEDSSNVDDLLVLNDVEATSLLLNVGVTATLDTDQFVIT
jgi:hypothetical protein